MNQNRIRRAILGAALVVALSAAPALASVPDGTSNTVMFRSYAATSIDIGTSGSNSAQSGEAPSRL